MSPATMYIFAGSSRTARGKAMSFYGMSLGVATLVGFGLSGILVSRLGYKDFFLFGTAILIVGAAVGLLLPRAEKKGNMAIKTSSGEGFKKVKDLFRRKGLLVSYISIFAQYFTFGGVVTLLPLYVRSLGMGTFHMGMLLAIFAIMFVIAQFPSGALSDRVGRLIPTTIGLSIGIVSLIVLPAMGTFPTLAAVMALYGIAYGVLFPSISAIVVDNTIPEERGTATGIFHALLTAGVATGAPIIGWVGEMVGVELGLALSAAIMFLALAIALKALRRS